MSEICELCKKEITGKKAVTVNNGGSQLYHFDEPKKDSCYIKFLNATNEEWVTGAIIAEEVYE